MKKYINTYTVHSGKRNVCIYFNKKEYASFCWISTYGRKLSFFSGNANIYKMQTEQRNWVYVKNIFLHSTDKSLF